MKDVHLLVTVHGLRGLPSDLKTAAETLQKAHRDRSPRPDTEFNFLLAAAVDDAHTYDGIDWCAERVVNEIIDRKELLEGDGVRRVIRLSICAFGLGGLIARYIVGILYDRGFFQSVTPTDFTTFASPHLGLMEYDSWASKMTVFKATRMLSRVGPQLFARDKWVPGGQPLLLAMSDPEEIFYKALSSFRSIRIYANGIQDPDVPFLTASISTFDPFFDCDYSGIQVRYEPKYHPIIASYQMPKDQARSQISLYRRITVPRCLKNGAQSVLICAALPVLAPSFLAIYLTRYAGPNHASRRRIRAMERAVPAEARLARLWDPGNKEAMPSDAETWDTRVASPRTSDARTSRSSTRSPDFAGRIQRDGSKPPRRGAPVLTELQQRMAANLNTISHMKKYITFIPQYPNAHDIIVCKDPVGLPSHEAGRGVIRHWTDGFQF